IRARDRPALRTGARPRRAGARRRAHPGVDGPSPSGVPVAGLRRLGRGPPPRTVVLPGGGRMSVRTTMLGRRWSPYRYDDDEPVPPLPDWLVRAARSALEAASTVDHRVATDAGRPLAPEDY